MLTSLAVLGTRYWDMGIEPCESKYQVPGTWHTISKVTN
jgi:hypothetical protein